MRRAFAPLLLICVLSPAEVSAQGRSLETRVISTTLVASSLSQPLILRKAIEREARRLTPTLGRAENLRAQQPASRDRTWIRRHPALFGALVGAGAGAVSSVPRWNELYCAGGTDEDCVFHQGLGVLFGAGAGAGVGALIGSLVGR